VGYFCNFQKTAQSNKTKHWVKVRPIFAQSGHPECGPQTSHYLFGRAIITHVTVTVTVTLTVTVTVIC
jgi:hypothetical protein